MAMQQLTGAPERADHPAAMSAADRTAHELASYVRVSPEIRRAVTRYEICRDSLAALEQQDINTVPLFNELKNAQAGLAEAEATLAAAGRLDLIAAV
jgi:hypothetical protein